MIIEDFQPSGMRNVSLMYFFMSFKIQPRKMFSDINDTFRKMFGAKNNYGAIKTLFQLPQKLLTFNFKL